jgi:iron complex transport system ATP-binding protein
MLPETLVAEGLALAGRLEGVSLGLRSGEVTAICGPNGAGKSTLLACLAGILVADSGGVALANKDGEGEDLRGVPARARARALGYLPQGGEVAWDVSVETLVGLGRLPWQAAAGPRGIGQGARASREEDAAAVDEALGAMDLLGLRGRRVSRLSGGERARALLARVLAGRPGWILADEPLAALDLGHGAGLIARLGEQAKAGVGVVLVLHDLAVAMNHADRVVVMERGRVVADGAPQEALREEVIGRVWGVEARWIGGEGEKALVVKGF